MIREFRSRGHLYKIVPERRAASEEGERVDPRDAEGVLASPFADPIEGLVLRGAAMELVAGAPVREGHEALARLVRAVQAGTLVLLRVQPPRYRGPHKPVEPREEEDFDKPQQQPDTDWIEIQLLDEQGRGISGQRYLIVLPDGRERRGFTDSLGSARLNRIPSGSCKVSFPDLDAKAWAKGGTAA